MAFISPNRFKWREYKGDGKNLPLKSHIRTVIFSEGDFDVGYFDKESMRLFGNDKSYLTYLTDGDYWAYLETDNAGTSKE
jgi:hypothetical protein